MKQYTQDQTDVIASAFLDGQVLAFPTDTVYGVGVAYGNPDALIRLKKAKKREESKPIPMMTDTLDHARAIVQADDRAQAIADAFLPGALTLILPLQDDADRTYTNGKDTAALRIPDEPFLLEVMKKIQRPLLVTSANISGMPAALNKEEAMAMLTDIDGIVDGECVEMEASTIVDCTGDDIKILRQGPISLEQIQDALAKAGF